MHQTGCTQTYDDTGAAAAKRVVTNLLARSFQGQENILWPSWISGWQLLDVLLLSILANFSGVIPISKFLWHNSNLIMELEKVTADSLQQNIIFCYNFCVLIVNFCAPLIIAIKWSNKISVAYFNMNVKSFEMQQLKGQTWNQRTQCLMWFTLLNFSKYMMVQLQAQSTRWW